MPLCRVGGRQWLVGDGCDVSDSGLSPVVVVGVHEHLNPSAELFEGGEGVPVVVLVFEDGLDSYLSLMLVT